MGLLDSHLTPKVTIVPRRPTCILTIYICLGGQVCLGSHMYLEPMQHLFLAGGVATACSGRPWSRRSYLCLSPPLRAPALAWEGQGLRVGPHETAKIL